ncbi:hypothetical protein ABT040_21055 [Streptomyces sp. NPDC002688]|uniref:hypothetical protein n=1 Tax=Streptomyces sp. NPDC002688 TaxID=3154423 RepID=UPI0033195C0E
MALGGELRRRRDELSAAEHAVLALAEQHRTGAEGGAVEVISDIDAVRQRFSQLQESARHEVRLMMAPELSVVPRSANAAERAGVRRGVLYRTILHREALTEPGMVAQALADLAASSRNARTPWTSSTPGCSPSSSRDSPTRRSVPPRRLPPHRAAAHRRTHGAGRRGEPHPARPARRAKGLGLTGRRVIAGRGTPASQGRARGWCRDRWASTAPYRG